MTPVYRKGARASIFLVSLLALGSCTRCGSQNGEVLSKGKSVFQVVTGEDAEQDRTQWDSLYDRESYVFGKEPAATLQKFVEVLPVGKALDLAMGEGRNAVFLAKKGFIVEGVDLSEVAIRKAKRLARENGVSLETLNADLTTYQIRPESYEVIVNIRYLQRSLIPQIKKGLKRGGVVVFEGQLEALPQGGARPSARREDLLKHGEVQALFGDFKILHIHEWTEKGQAWVGLVAVKP